MAIRNDELTITAAGLTTSKRQARDGFTFFGTKSDDEEFNKQIDYDLNINNNNNSQTNSLNTSNIKANPVIFIIYFNKDIGKYFIRAHNTGLKKKSKDSNDLPYIIVQISKPYVRK